MLTNLSIRHWSKSGLGQTCIYFILGCFNLSYAMIPPSQSQPYEVTHQIDAQNETVPQSQQSMSMNSRSMGWNAPINIGVDYSSLTDWNVSAQYTKKFNSQFAASILGEYGDNMYRYGATLGAKFFQNGFAKISAEQFAQNLPFDFTSGEVNKFVKQNAVGARYQQNFHAPLLRNINGGIYYARAMSEELDTVTFLYKGHTALNYRNIAGSYTGGGDIGSTINISPTTEATASLYYDHLRYDTEFTEDGEDDAQGLGGGFGLKQLLGHNFALSGAASVREIYNTYTAELAWSPDALPGSQISVAGQSIVSQNDTPDNNIVSVLFGYNFGMGGAGARYSLASLNETQDVGQWTNTPAVYMEQVLAVAEERVVVKSGKSNVAELAEEASAFTITSFTPTVGPTAGNGVKVTITGTGFGTPGSPVITSVTFGGVPGTDFRDYQ